MATTRQHVLAQQSTTFRGGIGQHPALNDLNERFKPLQPACLAHQRVGVVLHLRAALCEIP